MHKNVFTLHVSFKRKGSYTEDEPDFSRQENLKVYGVHKVMNFKDFSRPNKEIKYFSRRLAKFKTFSRLYEPYLLIFIK